MKWALQINWFPTRVYNVHVCEDIIIKLTTFTKSKQTEILEVWHRQSRPYGRWSEELMKKTMYTNVQKYIQIKEENQAKKIVRNLYKHTFFLHACGCRYDEWNILQATMIKWTWWWFGWRYKILKFIYTAILKYKAIKIVPLNFFCSISIQHWLYDNN